MRGQVSRPRNAILLCRGDTLGKKRSRSGRRKTFRITTKTKTVLSFVRTPFRFFPSFSPLLPSEVRPSGLPLSRLANEVSSVVSRKKWALDPGRPSARAPRRTLTAGGHRVWDGESGERGLLPAAVKTCPRGSSESALVELKMGCLH